MKSSIFRPTTEADEHRLIEFLSRAFSVDAGTAFLDPTLLRWKYWTPREDYPESRSFVLERNGVITAHAGIWPVSIGTGEGRTRGAHMIDWASDPAAPGSGASLVQKFIRQFDFLYSIGGSAMTQSVLPAFGFQRVTETWMGARPLRPLRQMLVHQAKNWKLPLRLARNTWWSLSPARLLKSSWTAVEAPIADFNPPASCPRGRAFFRYLGQCPAIQQSLYRLLNNGQEEGWLALSLIQKQARLEGVWLHNGSPARLRSAYLAAQQAAARLGDAYEIVAEGSAGPSEAAALETGLRIARRTPVYLLQKSGTPLMPFEFQLADNDEFFLSTGVPAFLS
ncbi:MAG TPA: hypothetical protein VGK64_23385 [Bryobacteraceae bacterium]